MRRIFGWFLNLYPREHNEIFGDEMLAVLDATAAKLRGVAFARFVIAEIAGLLFGAGAEWAQRFSGAGGYVRQQTAAGSISPDPVVQARLRIAVNLRRMEYAIAHHDFARARRYADEDLRERELLRRLLEDRGQATQLP